MAWSQSSLTPPLPHKGRVTQPWKGAILMWFIPGQHSKQVIALWPLPQSHTTQKKELSRIVPKAICFPHPELQTWELFCKTPCSKSWGCQMMFLITIFSISDTVLQYYWLNIFIRKMGIWRPTMFFDRSLPQKEFSFLLFWEPFSCHFLIFENIFFLIAKCSSPTKIKVASILGNKSDLEM